MKIPAREYYDAISGSYDELYGEEQRKKLKIIENFLRNINKKFETGIDIGCGTGISTIILKKFVKYACACDVSMEMLKIAKGKEELRDVEFFICDIENRLNINKKFDLIFCITVLQDVNDPDSALKNIISLSKKDSLVVISVSYRGKGIDFWRNLIRKYFNIVKEFITDKDVIFFLEKGP